MVVPVLIVDGVVVVGGALSIGREFVVFLQFVANLRGDNGSSHDHFCLVFVGLRKWFGFQGIVLFAGCANVGFFECSDAIGHTAIALRALQDIVNEIHVLPV